MKLFANIALAVILLVGLVACSSESAPLPEHLVDKTSLNASGNRIQITVAHDITEAECEALIDEYRVQAEPAGQLSVHKPNKFNGAPAPWCVDNFEGNIDFNHSFF